MAARIPSIHIRGKWASPRTPGTSEPTSGTIGARVLPSATDGRGNGASSQSVSFPPLKKRDCPRRVCVGAKGTAMGQVYDARPPISESDMKIAVPRERSAGEKRVALVPDIVTRFTKAGITVAVEHDAGLAAGFGDADYTKAGATIAGDYTSLVADADVVARVGKPTDEELDAMRRGALLVGFLSPLGDPRSVERYAQRGLTAMSMELIPRTTKAQAMDALCSQANIAGYKAALIAASMLPKFFPMLTTAAGTIKPAKAFIIGAGVAGLQAIATCRRLGAVVDRATTRARW